MNIHKQRTCCFIGHRKIKNEIDTARAVYKIVEDLILNKNIDTFLFGDKSQFDSLCYEVVTDLKAIYPHINRIYVRSAYPEIEDFYRNCLLKSYDDTYFPEKMANAGKACYVERNYDMIDKSSCCVFYYDENYAPPRRKNSKRDLLDYQPKSGTAIAYSYAVSKKQCIINVLPLI